ncbi:MAG: transcriptional repressor [Arcobacteraceae bacterium]|nr:transcriptional repressor [Arcobacteraceae bacterium]
MNNYTIMLREHNLKATPQRIAIIDIIDKYGHINIDKLYESIKNKFESISLATIYKNIHTMSENLLLLEVKLPNEKSVYEIVKGKHSHLLCNSCHSIIDIEVDTNMIENSISSKYSFNIDQSDLVLSGRCKNCLT